MSGLSRDVPTATDEDAAAPLASLPGPLATRFRMVDRLTVGSQATLFRVKDMENNGSLRVLKLYVPSAFRAGHEAHFVRLGRLREKAIPGLAGIEDMGTVPTGEGCRVWELLEWIEGITLREWLKCGPPEPDAAANLLRRLTDALAAVHERGLVFGDLKPGNVVLRGGQPAAAALVDFGCLAEHDKPSDQAWRPTPRYRPPQWWQSPWPGRAFDYWALGLIAHELFVGRHPLDGYTPPEIEQALITHSVKLGTFTDARHERLCAGLLCYSPEDRWQEEQVRDWLAGGDPKVPPRGGALPLGAFRCFDTADLREALQQRIAPPLAASDWERIYRWLNDRPQGPAWIAGLKAELALADVGDSPIRRQLAAAIVLDPDESLAYGGLPLDPAQLAGALVPGGAATDDNAVLETFDNGLLGFVAARLRRLAGPEGEGDARASGLEGIGRRWRAAWARYSGWVGGKGQIEVAAWFRRVSLHAAAEADGAAAAAGPHPPFFPGDAADPALQPWREYGAAIGFPLPLGYRREADAIALDAGAWPDPSLFAEALATARSGEIAVIRLRPGRYDWPLRPSGQCIPVPAGTAIRGEGATAGTIRVELRGRLVLEARTALRRLSLRCIDLPDESMILARGDDIRIKNCELHGFCRCFVELAGGGSAIERVTLAGSDQRGPAVGECGVLVQGKGGARIERCTIALTHPTDGVAVGVQIVGAAAAVAGCTIEGGAGIRGERVADGCAITGNTVRRATGIAIDIHGGAGHRIEANIIEAPQRLAIRLDRSNAAVRGNRIADAKADGILLENCPGALLEGNQAGLFDEDARGLAITLSGRERIELRPMTGESGAGPQA